MSQLPEAFVATPLSTLCVWASDERTLHAATMTAGQKAQPAYRDHPAAQGCAEHLLINRIAYTLYLNLVTAKHPDLERWPPVSPAEHGWAVPGADGALRLRRADSDLAPGTDAAIHRVRTLVVPALAAWATTPAGTAFRLRAGRQAVQAELQLLGGQLATLQARRAQLGQREAELARQLHELTTRQQGGAAR